MSIANPYQPPRAQVDDVRGTSGQHQPVKFWSTKGRVSRLQYLGYTMGAYLLLIGGAAILGGIAGALGHAKAAPIFGLIAMIPYGIFAVFMMIQRAHDMDWSGWTCLLAFIPLVALFWIFKAGTPGDNRFGAPPPPNTTKVKILALLMPVIAAIGILAAVLLPMYMSHKVPAQSVGQQASP